jgi:hypothetical protein
VATFEKAIDEATGLHFVKSLQKPSPEASPRTAGFEPELTCFANLLMARDFGPSV